MNRVSVNQQLRRERRVQDCGGAFAALFSSGHRFPCSRDSRCWSGRTRRMRSAHVRSVARVYLFSVSAELAEQSASVCPKNACPFEQRPNRSLKTVFHPFLPQPLLTPAHLRGPRASRLPAAANLSGKTNGPMLEPCAVAAFPL